MTDKEYAEEVMSSLPQAAAAHTTAPAGVERTTAVATTSTWPSVRMSMKHAQV